MRQLADAQSSVCKIFKLPNFQIASYFCFRRYYYFVKNILNMHNLV